MLSSTPECLNNFKEDLYKEWSSFSLSFTEYAAERYMARENYARGDTSDDTKVLKFRPMKRQQDGVSLRLGSDSMSKRPRQLLMTDDDAQVAGSSINPI